MENASNVKARKATKSEVALRDYFIQTQFGQIELLDQSAKRIIELIGIMLSILFGITAFGSDFPPPYLSANPIARLLVVFIVVFYLFAMLVSMLAINPRRFTFGETNLSDKKKVFDDIVQYKSRRVFWGGAMFLAGSTLLGLLIISIVLRG